MVRSILIGLDGSVYSCSALQLGICWTQRFDALLVGLGVIDEPTIRKSGTGTAPSGAFVSHGCLRRVSWFVGLDSAGVRCAKP